MVDLKKELEHITSIEDEKKEEIIGNLQRNLDVWQNECKKMKDEIIEKNARFVDLESKLEQIINVEDESIFLNTKLSEKQSEVDDPKNVFSRSNPQNFDFKLYVTNKSIFTSKFYSKFEVKASKLFKKGLNLNLSKKSNNFTKPSIKLSFYVTLVYILEV